MLIGFNLVNTHLTQLIIGWVCVLFKWVGLGPWVNFVTPTHYAITFVSLKHCLVSSTCQILTSLNVFLFALYLFRQVI